MTTVAPTANGKSTKTRVPTLPSIWPASLCARWLLALLLEGRGNEDVRAVLGADMLPCPPADEIDALRAAYLPPRFKPAHAKSKALLDALGLADYFRKAPATNEALFILRQPRIRELVEAGTVVGVPAAAIALTLRTHLKRALSPAGIESYKSMLFDTSALSRSQLQVLVTARVRLAVAGLVSGPEDQAAARRAVAADPRVVALSLPSTPLSWSSVLMAAGHPPGRRDLADVIRQLESVAALRAGEALLRGKPDDERRAAGYVATLEKVRLIAAMLVTPDAEVASKLSAFRVQHADQRMTTIDELRARGDDCTVDVAPMMVEAGDESGAADDPAVSERPATRIPM